MKKVQLLKTCCLLLFLAMAIICQAQVETIYVKPIKTDPNYSADGDSTAVSRNKSLQVNKLVLFLGGTDSHSSDHYVGLRVHCAGLGYDFVNLTYPNTVAAVSLKNNLDSLAFNKYRQEIGFGTQLSDAVEVDSFNSIYTRALKMIQYLDSTYPTQNWNEYLTNSNALNWSNIIIGGHSQGSGHAAYFAKRFAVDRVLMFAGPNDYSDHFSNSANWLRTEGVTPTTRHFCYLSLYDEIVSYDKQVFNLSGLGMLENDTPILVDDIAPPYNDSHCLYTTQPPGLVIINHNVPVKYTSINTAVWTYMLTSAITTKVEENEIPIEFSVFPNPVNSEIHLQSSHSLKSKVYIIQNELGQIVLSGKISETNQDSLDLSNLAAGIYFLTIDGSSVQIVKQ